MENNSTQNPTKNKNPMVFIGLIIAAIAVILFVSNRNKNDVTETPTVTTGAISGVIDFNGIKPSDASDPNAGEIILKARKSNTSDEFTDTGVKIMFTDNASWVWNNAESGANYDLMGEVYYKNELIKQSAKVTATAPATNVPIIFNVTLSDIPENIRPVPTPEAATVSGVVTVNGFIPQGSVLKTFARINGTNTDFRQVGDNMPAAASVPFSYNNATAGTTYEVQVELYNSSNTFIGQSAYITVTAPAVNEKIVVNSTAQAPSQSANINGTITVNGPFQQNSTILLLQREQGQTDYSVITRYDPKSTIPFQWTGAVAGRTYDLTTALQINENNVASGNVVTVTAPANNVALTLNTGVNIPAPSGTPSITCGNPDSTNGYNAQINVPQISGAQKYYVTVGTSAGSNNVYSQSINPNSHATVYIQGNTNYFTRYSYSFCSDCNLNDSSNWSGWSPTLGFQCPNVQAVPLPY